MQEPSSGSERRYLHLLVLVLTLLSFTTAFAQTDPNTKIDAGNGGRNSLQGDIYLPGGKRLDRTVLIKLGTARGEINTTSNGNGSFMFRGLTGGRYEVRVDAGEAFEPAWETVEIAESGSGQQSRPGQTYMVQIYLRPRAANLSHRTAVISADSTPAAAVELYEKAIVSVKNGQRDQAIEQLKAAVSIYPSFVAALNGLGVQYLKTGAVKKAIEVLMQAKKFSPNSPMVRLNLGIALLRDTRYADADAELARAIELNPGSGAAHLYKARALIGLKRLDLAERELEKAIAIGGDDVVMARRYLGGVYMEKGEHAKAIRVLEEYLRLVPDSADTVQIRRLISQLRAQEKKG